MDEQRKVDNHAYRMLADAYLYFREDEAHWCKHAFAKDKNGDPCDPRAKQAESFDVIGILWRVAYRLDYGLFEYRKAVPFLQQVVNHLPIQIWNDSANYKEILQTFAKAITLAEMDWRARQVNDHKPVEVIQLWG